MTTNQSLKGLAMLRKHGVLSDELAAQLPADARDAFHHLTAMTDHRGDGIPTQYLYPVEVRAAASVLCAAALRSYTGAGDADHLRHMLDRDRYVVAIALGHIRKALNSHRWLLEGRGPYEWDDDKYRDEFTAWAENVERSTGLLAKLAWDKDDCTRDSEKVAAAKIAAREYAKDAPKGHRSMLPSDLGLPCPTCAASPCLDAHLSRTPDREPFDRKAVLEEAARVAEGMYEAHGFTLATDRARNYEHAARRIASAIRALSTKDGEQIAESANCSRGVK